MRRRVFVSTPASLEDMSIDHAPMHQFLLDAGLGRGMRVLDLGCGGGVTTRLIAELVGPQGQVLGVDRNVTALGLAREANELSQVAYREHDLTEPLADEAPFDAIVARRVLLYLPNPAEVLHWALGLLKVGGIAAFLELDSSVTPASTSPMPLHERVNGWIWDTIKAEGGNVRMGMELPGLLQDCGLEVQDVQVRAEADGFPDSMATVLRFILPRAEKHLGVNADDVDLDTLEARLRHERIQTGSVYLRNLSVSVWARKLV
jgi:SAM-dependent methyltransferase